MGSPRFGDQRDLDDSLYGQRAVRLIEVSQMLPISPSAAHRVGLVAEHLTWPKALPAIALMMASCNLVVRGQGRAEVIATGPRSEIGKIGGAIAGVEIEPPRLQAETGRPVRRFAAVSLSLSVFAILLYGLLRDGWLNAVLRGIALGMSMLPQEIPVGPDRVHGHGAWRIPRARVLTRRVTAIETLGAATVLCTDKTGGGTARCVPRVLSEPIRGADSGCHDPACSCR